MVDFMYQLERQQLICAIACLTELTRALIVRENRSSHDLEIVKLLESSINKRWGKEIDGLMDKAMHDLADQADNDNEHPPEAATDRA